MFSGELFPTLMLFFGCLSGCYYCYTNYQNLQAWKRFPANSHSDSNSSDHIFFSVLVPARNESENIVNCLESILAQDYPKDKYEIIFINDHSTDNTFDLVRKKFGNQVRSFSLDKESEVGKKAAIQKGIDQSKGDWIITTDADCIVGKKWIEQFSFKIQESDVVFCCAPVMFSEHNNLLEIFQQMDLMGMMGVTAGGIQRKAAYLANGANLAYQKTVFKKVNGFEGISEKASGDDMLLLQKVAKQFPNQIAFIKDADCMVQTTPEKTLNAFLSQRLRWASKGNAFPNFSTWLQMVLVFLFSLILVLSLGLAFFQPYIYLKIFIGFYLIKFFSDYIYLSKLSSFFGKEKLNKQIWWGSLAHAFYIVFIGIWAQFYKSYQWKGRSTK